MFELLFMQAIHYLVSGGSCNLCGSQKHLKKDCPLRKGADGNSQTGMVFVSRAIHGIVSSAFLIYFEMRMKFQYTWKRYF